MKRLIFFLLLIISCSCRNFSTSSAFDNIEKIQGQADAVKLEIVDTLVVNATSTSLSGEWLLPDSTLVFLDKAIVPIKRFTLTGEYQERFFRYGRGPEEFISPALSFHKLSPDSYLYVDRNSNLILLDSVFRRKKEINFLREIARDIDPEKLYRHPDPENPAMYELEVGDNQISVFGGKIICPVTTEHIRYNGYFKKSKAFDFYRRSYTLVALDTATLNFEQTFGNYPPVYHNRIIPNFKACHTATDGNLLYVSYEADPKIYVYDKQLALHGYFGEAVPGISSGFPSTNDLDEAERNYKMHRKTCGYYSKIKCADNYLFRRYQLPGERPGLQIYREGMLVCDTLPAYSTFDIIGYYPPYYYALAGTDLENETFSIITFQLKQDEK